jgi:Nucleotidyl transferase AbiEii toxin, Type IV TA system
MLQDSTVEPRTLELLKQLMLLPELDNYYLVGGTALALQIGHRMSIDLDLFTTEPIDMSYLLDFLSSRFENLRIESEGKQMLITNINDIKVDFVKMSYPILYPPLMIDGVRMLALY